jgi:DNA mismatch endonuclease (patch repair protein)
MTDVFEKGKRSEIMSRIRSRDTRPEKIVRNLLHKGGYRFRLHRKDLPGRPDIVLPKYGTVIFVHGCFWHQHKGCGRATIPKSNEEYWVPKLKRNIERFEEVVVKLRGMGWKIVQVWECETANIERLSKKLDAMLRKGGKR